MTQPVRLRLLQVRCPCCDGSGKSQLFPTCAWCMGTGRVSPATAKLYAATITAIAEGGYLAGDHDFGEARTMRARANEIMSFIRLFEVAA